MAGYENKSKKLLEDYDKIFRKLGASTILPQFEGSDLRTLEVILKWSSSATIGAKILHRFRIYTWRADGDDAFAPTMLRGSLLLSNKVEFDRPHQTEIFAAQAKGLMSKDGEAIVLQRISPLALAEHPALQAQMDALLAEKSHSDETLGELEYNAPMNSFCGQLRREERMISVEFRETAPDRIAEQAEKMKAFLRTEDYLSKSEAQIREHAKFKSHARGEETEVLLHGLTLVANRLEASFHIRPSSLEYGNVICLWQEGKFARLRVDHIEASY